MVDLGELVEFLILNQSLFNFRMTRFFTVNFPDKLYAEVNLATIARLRFLLIIIFYLLLEETQFVEKCQQLGLNSAWTSVSSSATPIPKGLTPKKYHEITRFAAFLANIIQQTPVDCIVDIGCGLVSVIISLSSVILLSNLHIGPSC